MAVFSGRTNELHFDGFTFFVNDLHFSIGVRVSLLSDGFPENFVSLVLFERHWVNLFAYRLGAFAWWFKFLLQFRLDLGNLRNLNLLMLTIEVKLLVNENRRTKVLERIIHWNCANIFSALLIYRIKLQVWQLVIAYLRDQIFR